MYIELYDSVTGQILARAIDRKAARESMHFQISSRAKNVQEARRVLKKWAVILRDGFDEIRIGGKIPGLKSDAIDTSLIKDDQMREVRLVEASISAKQPGRLTQRVGAD